MSQERRIIGRILSITSMSLPSRLRIRPIGVVSKNDIGLRRTCSSVLSKIRLEAITVPLARNSAIANTVTPTTIGNELWFIGLKKDSFLHIRTFASANYVGYIQVFLRVREKERKKLIIALRSAMFIFISCSSPVISSKRHICKFLTAVTHELRCI